jgi:hypothetical protein
MFKMPFAHTSTQDILNIYTQLFNFLTAILTINISHDVWIVENIFINNYILKECTYHCITYSVTAHPDDGEERPKHVGATHWENAYHVCILLVFISNYTTMHGVEHTKNETWCLHCSNLKYVHHTTTVTDTIFK